MTGLTSACGIKDEIIYDEHGYIVEESVMDSDNDQKIKTESIYDSTNTYKIKDIDEDITTNIKIIDCKCMS